MIITRKFINSKIWDIETNIPFKIFGFRSGNFRPLAERAFRFFRSVIAFWPWCRRWAAISLCWTLSTRRRSHFRSNSRHSRRWYQSSHCYSLVFSTRSYGFLDQYLKANNWKITQSHNNLLINSTISRVLINVYIYFFRQTTFDLMILNNEIYLSRFSRKSFSKHCYS